MNSGGGAVRCAVSCAGGITSQSCFPVPNLAREVMEAERLETGCKRTTRGARVAGASSAGAPKGRDVDGAPVVPPNESKMDLRPPPVGFNTQTRSAESGS